MTSLEQTIQQLRERALKVQATYDADETCLLAPSARLVAAWPTEVLALLDIAEAAQALLDELRQGYPELFEDDEWPGTTTLDAALARLTETPRYHQDNG